MSGTRELRVVVDHATGSLQSLAWVEPTASWAVGCGRRGGADARRVRGCSGRAGALPGAASVSRTCGPGPRASTRWSRSSPMVAKWSVYAPHIARSLPCIPRWSTSGTTAWTTSSPTGIGTVATRGASWPTPRICSAPERTTLCTANVSAGPRHAGHRDLRGCGEAGEPALPVARRGRCPGVGVPIRTRWSSPRPARCCTDSAPTPRGRGPEGHSRGYTTPTWARMASSASEPLFAAVRLHRTRPRRWPIPELQTHLQWCRSS